MCGGGGLAGLDVCVEDKLSFVAVVVVVMIDSF